MSRIEKTQTCFEASGCTDRAGRGALSTFSLPGGLAHGPVADAEAAMA